MKSKLLLSLLLLMFGIVSRAQDSVQFALADSVSLSIDSVSIDTNLSPNVDEITIVFAGDIMGHDTQILGAYIDSSDSYNYEPTFRFVKDYITSADIAIGNLEVTLAGPPFKGYPQFSSPDALAIEAKNAGFDVMVTANNHAADRGSKGIERTIKVLDSLNFAQAGSYLSDSDKVARYPLILEKKGYKLAILNYTYGTNGIKVHPPYIVNRIDTAQIRKDILKAKLAEPDYIIAITHWGKEYERTENKRQQQITRFMFDLDVDAVIGSHPHVIQPIRIEFCSKMDTIENCPVIYSMGNFVSNQRAQYKDGGVMAELHLSKDVGGGVQFDSLCYLPYWVYREKVKEEKFTFYVLPIAKYENDSAAIVNFNDNDLYRFNRFKNDTRLHLRDAKESTFYTVE